MNKLFYLMSLMLIIVNLNAIQSIEFDHLPVPYHDKAVKVAYHNESRDHLFYGSDTWGVFFDFDNYYSEFDTLFFNINSAIVYSYQNRSNVKVSLYEHSITQPGSLIESKTVDLITGWNEILFSNTSRRKVWLVVEDATSNIEPQNYITASNGTGAQSYFKSNNGFYNFKNYGFQAELLFSLKGTFNREFTDLVIKDFSYDEEILPGATIKPNITLLNQSDYPVISSHLIINYSNPNNELNRRDSIGVFTQIPANSEYQLNSELIPELNLLASPNQYLVNISLIVHNDNEITENNTKTFIINCFNIEQDTICVENFIQSNSVLSNQMWNYQNTLINSSQMFRIDYYPDVSDYNYNNLHLSKNKFYNNYFYPNSIINGSKKIQGFQSDFYGNMFNDMSAQALTEKTFLSIDRVIIDTLETNIKFEFSLRNQDTRLFTNYLSECVIQVSVIQPYNINDHNSYMVTNTFSNLLSGTEITCNYGSEQSLSGSLAQDQFVFLADNVITDCKLLIQVYHKSSKQVLYFSTRDFPLLTINHANQPNNPSYPVSIYPNPVNNKSELKIKSEGLKKISIFNIKGQKVKELVSNNEKSDTITWNMLTDNHQRASSGIYFIKIHYHDQHEKIQKVLIIK